MMKQQCLLTIILGLLILGACEKSDKSSKADGQPPEKVKIQVMWVPNAQFAGYYVAMEKGFYAEEGLEIHFNPYDENTAVIDAVTDGRADFGIDGADQVLIGRSEGKDLKAVAVTYRRNPTAFASLKESGITKPKDLIGKKIGILPDATGSIFRALMKKYQIKEQDLQLIPYGYNFNMLIDKVVDVIPIYIFDEPYKLKQLGIDLNILLPLDYGVNAYGDTIFTTDRLIKDKPRVVEEFVKASLKGWRFALENVDETIQIVLKYDHEDYKDQNYESNILNFESPLINTGEDEIGWMKDAVWTEMYRMLHDAGLIKQPVNVKDVYTMDFIKKIYQN